MSEKPELPSAEALRKALIPQGRGGVLDRMARVQHEALREPWCPAVSCQRGFLFETRNPCSVCGGSGLNPRARAVLEVGEAAGLGKPKETP